MVTLSDFLPPDTRDSGYIFNQLKEGNVFAIKLNNKDHGIDCQGHPDRRKFCIVLGKRNDDLIVAIALINSEINANVDQEVKDLHIDISQNEYPFLDYDSKIDASKFIEIQKEYFKKNINSTDDCKVFHSTISEELLGKIITNITSSSLFIPKLKKKYPFFNRKGKAENN